MHQKAAAFDAFVSYSHAADDLLAPRLQAGLQRFAKPWWRRRAMRVFRDESSLSANPHLWSSITEALDGSEWFVVLMSPDAARSEWVNQEIAYWVEHKDPSRVIPVLTAGEFGWSDGDVSGDAVPDALRGVFAEEPRWVDLRFASSEEKLDLQDPRFADAVADIASAIRGVAKDELASEEVRQHRRTVRTAWAGGVAVVVLGVAAAVGAVVAVGQSNEAQDQRDEAQRQAAIARQEEQSALEAKTDAEEAAAAESQARALASAREYAASAIGVLDDDPELAMLLALEAIDATPDDSNQPVEVVNSLWQARIANRLVRRIEIGDTDPTGAWISLSPDGSSMVVASPFNAWVRLIDTSDGGVKWEYLIGTEDDVRLSVMSPDGRYVAVPVAEPEARFSADRDAEPDPRPARVVILDGATGAEVAAINFPDCLQAETPTWSINGEYLAVSEGAEPCVREGAPSGWWVEVFDTTTWESMALLELPGDYGWGAVPVFDDTGRLFVFGDAETVVYEGPPFQLVQALPRTFGFGDVSSDGNRVLSSYFDRPRVSVFDVESGERLDELPVDWFPDAPREVRFSPQARYVGAGVRGAETIVWGATPGANDYGKELFRFPGIAPNFDDEAGLLYTRRGDSIQVWNLGPPTVGRAIGDLGTTWVAAYPFQLGSAWGAFLTVEADRSALNIRFFDVNTGEIHPEFISEWPWDVVALEGDRFVFSSNGALWRIHDLEAGTETPLIGCSTDAENPETCADSGEQAPAYNVFRSVDGRELAAVEQTPEGDFGAWTIFDAASGEVKGTEEHGSRRPVTFTDDWVILQGEQSDIQAVNRSSGEVLWMESVPIARIEVSPSGKRVAYSSNANALTILDTVNWSARTPDLPFLEIRAFAFEPGESRLAVIDTAAIHVLDLTTDTITQSIPIPQVADVHWLDASTLLVGTRTGAWISISLDVGDLVAEVRRSLIRSFTDQECLTYRIDPCPTLSVLRNR